MVHNIFCNSKTADSNILGPTESYWCIEVSIHCFYSDPI